MIITKTPMRISMGGGGTDLPFFYSKYGGSLVSATIDKYVYIATNKRFEKKIRLAYSVIEEVGDIDNLKNDRAKEAFRLLDIKNSLDVTTVADLPSRSGLGGSASFLVGLLNGLHRAKGEITSKKILAEEACKIEMDILKYPVGKQDQYAVSYGGINHLKIDKKGNVRISPINISEESISLLEKNIMLFYTGIRRDSKDVLNSQKKNAESDENRMSFMKEIMKIGEKSRKSLERGDTDKFGRLLHMHWKLKQSISNKMSNEKIDHWYSIAIKNGALGGKIIGAGGGGFLMFYTRNFHEKISKLMEKEGLKKIDFKFDFDGTRTLVDKF